MNKKSQRSPFSTTRSKPTRTGVPEAVKAEVTTKANRLIEQVLKPQHIQPPPDPPLFNYIVDIYGRWHQRYFYICATYCVPGPHAQVPSFEAKMARMEYKGNNRFCLSFQRHNGQWIELYTNITLEEGLASIQDEPFFFP